MRNYGVIQSTYWTHPDIKPLRDGAKLLGAYLLTGPHTNALGCFHAPIGYVATDLGWSTETVSKGFRELFENGFCNRCERTEYVLIHNFLRWNPISNANVAKARVDEFNAIPRGFSYFNELAASLREYGSFWPNSFETLLKGFPNPFETGSKPEQTRPEQTIGDFDEESASPKQSEEAKPDRLVRFDEFWFAYPKKAGKQDAMKAWKALKPSDDLIGAILSDVIDRARSDKSWIDGYAPHPATYIRGRRWEDERTSDARPLAAAIFAGDV